MRDTVIQLTDDYLRSKRASDFVNFASQFSSSVYLEINNKRINAKSIIGVLSLNVKTGDNVKLLVDGQDEKDAMERLVELLTN